MVKGWHKTRKKKGKREKEKGRERKGMYKIVKRKSEKEKER